MSIPLLIFAAVAALLTVLLQLRIHFCITYKDTFDYSVRYLMFSYRNKREEEGHPKEKKEVKAKEKLNLAQIHRFLDLFERVWKNAKTVILKVGRKIRIDRLAVELTVGTDDAAQTAVTYGEGCAVIYPAVAMLENIVRIKRRQILINADFENNHSELTFECHGSIRLGGIVSTGLVTGIKVLLSLTKNPINIGKRGVAK